MSAESKWFKAWIRLVKWVHDSLIFVALFVLFTAFGGLRLFGYSYEFALSPYEVVPDGYTDKLPDAKRSR